MDGWVQSEREWRRKRQLSLGVHKKSMTGRMWQTKLFSAIHDDTQPKILPLTVQPASQQCIHNSAACNSPPVCNNLTNDLSIRDFF